MWKLDAYYHQNIKPIIKNIIEDSIDLGRTNCPDIEDLNEEDADLLAAKLFLSDEANLDPLADIDFKCLIVESMSLNKGVDANDLEDYIANKLKDYYQDTINEILEYEYKEIYDEYHDGLREEYQFDQEC